MKLYRWLDYHLREIRNFLLLRHYASPYSTDYFSVGHTTTDGTWRVDKAPFCSDGERQGQTIEDYISKLTLL